MTIIRDDHDYLRLESPQIYRYPILLHPGGLEEPSTVTAKCGQIMFAPEYDTDVHFPDVYVKVWDVPWRWHCMDCYAACGDRRDIFKTDWARREDLGGKGNREIGGFYEPTSSQQQQMNQHAKQHSIMWNWARNLLK